MIANDDGGLLPALDGAFPDGADAVRMGVARMSWEELRRSADATAARIAGAPAVAVVAEPTTSTVVGVVGGLLAGVPVVPIPPDSGPSETAHILTDSGAALLRPDGSLTAPLGSPPPPSADALILYTSGTTGPPKGVRLGREAIAADLDALAAAWAWTPEDVLVHGLPLFHVHGLVLGLLGPLRIGSRLVHTVRPTPVEYAAAGGSLFFGVPTVWSRIVQAPDAARALRPARLLVSGSAALPEPVFDGLRALTGHRPVERYGMTETLITLSTRADGPRTPGTVGTPLAGVQTRLTGDGELQVRGPTLFDGYLHRPDPRTPDGWFPTGDIATIDADGAHRIVGRADVDVIKTGGFRVGAGEVEAGLLAHPAVREAAVVGRPHADLGQEIVAYVVASGVDEGELIGFVGARLSRHKRPRRVVFVDALPRNALGKIQKKLLRDDATG
jgi:fatty acid CoA ligase FadD36